VPADSEPKFISTPFSEENFIGFGSSSEIFDFKDNDLKKLADKWIEYCQIQDYELAKNSLTVKLSVLRAESSRNTIENANNAN